MRHRIKFTIFYMRLSKAGLLCYLLCRFFSSQNVIVYSWKYVVINIAK